MKKKEIDLFVPGRLCLFGEHSDWAGGHRRQNSEIERGYVIVTPTNQGNYSKVTELDSSIFQFISKPLGKTLETKMDEDELLKVAEEGGELSYVAGVVHEIISSYHKIKRNGGIRIENYRTDLPIKKGLSSSASICVLTAKAFNEIYDLDFTPKRVMELAYLGETTTPSRCGKMDQACAFDNPVLMIFDGDRMKVEKLKVGQDIYFLVVDLKKEKNTRQILSDLNQGFPWPRSEIEERKHQYFKMNKEIVLGAKEAIKKGDAFLLGTMLDTAQRYFDEYLMPSSRELEAPVLHSLLSMSEIKTLIYGGKGVGSGGDGTAQIICKSKLDREKAREILTNKNFECLDLDLKKTS